MTFLHTLPEKFKSFLWSRSENALGRHQIIVYLLHSALVFTVITAQLLGGGGSQEVLPRVMSGIHLGACLIALLLYLKRRIALPVAFSIVTLVAQATIACRFAYFAETRPDHFLQLILLNQVTSILAIVFLVMSFVKYTPFVVAAISLTTYGSVAKYLGEPSLWNVFIFFILVEGLLCLLGELLRRNVRNVQTENSALQHRESTLMRAIRLNPAEVEGYLRMSRTSDPTEEDVDRLFEMLTPVSQQNLINAVRIHLKQHLMDDCDLEEIFPCLTKSEIQVAKLILEGKKRSEMALLLGKTGNNIDVVRTHIRSKLGVQKEEDLQRFLKERVMETKNNKRRKSEGKKKQMLSLPSNPLVEFSIGKKSRN